MAVNINMSILNEFGLQPKKIVREKAYYICETSGGLFKVIKTSDPPERIIFRHAVKKHAAASGYPWVDGYYEAPTGLPYVTVSGETWTAASFVRGREASFENWGDTARVVEAVRRWHMCVRNVAADCSRFTAPPLTDFFRKQSSELTGMIKFVRRQTRLSDFDVLLIKNAAAYSEQIKTALNLLEESDYSKRYGQALAENHICHRMLKEESLTVSGEQIYITHCEEAAADIQLADLCAVIRRYAQRSGFHAVPAGRILEAADKVEPFSAGDIKILYAMLLFPWQFMKTASQYYSKKRTWTPGAITNRMQTIISEAGFFNKYIEEIKGV